MTQSIGPPSLAQGTRIAVGFSTSISRFIPACGELSKPSWAIVQLDGSSPLTRGTLCMKVIHPDHSRFIPAYAGNSLCHVTPSDFPTVHPRLRGELRRHQMAPFFYDGSSPLTRGTLIYLTLLANAGRFIPAYAGNSSARYGARSAAAVHPRLRGELRGQSIVTIEKVGSSPLTRGTHLKTV